MARKTPYLNLQPEEQKVLSTDFNLFYRPQETPLPAGMKEFTDTLDNFVNGGATKAELGAEVKMKKSERTKHLKDYNSNLENSIRAEDCYGGYLKMYAKRTNYIPVEGKLLGDSRNNVISTEDGQKNNVRFLMIIIPNNDTCKNNIYFSALIKTEIIKSLSGFSKTNSKL